jgi:mannose-1-phosphate guanylyltransferase/mannose-6-phosphate isomerase
MPNITPIILAGGSGKRLWPASSESCPKQFCNLIPNELTLFQETVIRYSTTEDSKYNPPIIVTSSKYANFVKEQLREIDKKAGCIICEPESKNTTASILVGVIDLLDKGIEHDPVLVVPSDQYFQHTHYINSVFKKSAKDVDSHEITIFGVTPNKPTSSYGYIRTSNKSTHEAGLIEEFIEKPNVKKAKELYESKTCLWNSGIFLFTPLNIFKLYETLSPEVVKSVTSSYKKAYVEDGIIHLDRSSWSECKEIAFDYEILERADDVFVVPLDTKWSDLGTWDAIWSTFQTDSNLIDDNSFSYKSSGLLLRNYLNTKLIGIGLKDTVVVQTDKVTMVIDKALTSNIDKIVSSIPKDVINSPVGQRHFRPWGYFENLKEDVGYKVKSLHISPNSRISLQYHNKRSEHWTIVKGIANIEIDGKYFTLKEGSSIDIPKKSIHRIENIHDDILEIIEVQKGAYLAEDDIVRIEDDYDRVLKK